MISKKVFPRELIGEEIQVVDSTNKSDLSITGKVVDETKMTLKVDQQGRIKTILKSNVAIKLLKTGELISGSIIGKRPEDRIKGK